MKIKRCNTPIDIDNAPNTAYRMFYRPDNLNTHMFHNIIQYTQTHTRSLARTRTHAAVWWWWIFRTRTHTRTAWFLLHCPTPWNVCAARTLQSNIHPYFKRTVCALSLSLSIPFERRIFISIALAARIHARVKQMRTQAHTIFYRPTHTHTVHSTFAPNRGLLLYLLGTIPTKIGESSNNSVVHHLF